MIQPLISVYITNFNYGKFLEKSIQSVISQTMQNFELIIIDDGSTDDSHLILNKYANYKKINVIYQQNKGLNVTNNIAMRLAKGKYLIRLDADDYLEPSALETMSQILENDDELGLVFPDYYYVDEQNNIVAENKRHNFETEVSLYDLPAHGACTMIRLEFLKKLGGYNESFTCQDGYDLWLKFITHHKVTNINKPLFFYRRHNSNLTNNENKILKTRQAIKESFIKERFDVEKSIVIIPVRTTIIGNQNLPLFKINQKTILEHKVETCLRAKNIASVIIVSSNDEIVEYASTVLGNRKKVFILKRPPEYAKYNKSLNDTISLAFEFAANNHLEFTSIITAALEYPFVSPELIDEVIYTQILFNSDSVLTVRPDFNMYYQHTGHTLKPILEQDKFTRLEREALYKAVGGLSLTTLSAFNNQKEISKRRISHVIVDEKTAFKITNEFELDVFNRIKKDFILES